MICRTIVNMHLYMLSPVQLVGFTSDEVQSAYEVLAAILHLGNVNFCDGSTATVLDQAPVIEGEITASTILVAVSYIDKLLYAII